MIKLGPQFTPRITNKSLQHLSKIATLEEIEVSETWLTYDAGFVHLKKLPKLRLLTLKLVHADEKDIALLKADCILFIQRGTELLQIRRRLDTWKVPHDVEQAL